MSCPVCSTGQLKSILVEPDNYFMCAKFPNISKSSSDDSCCDIITTPPDCIRPEDIRGMHAETVLTHDVPYHQELTSWVILFCIMYILDIIGCIIYTQFCMQWITDMHCINVYFIHSIVLFCYNVSLSAITLRNNTLYNRFVGVDAIKDGSHLCLKVIINYVTSYVHALFLRVYSICSYLVAKCAVLQVKQFILLYCV